MGTSVLRLIVEPLPVELFCGGGDVRRIPSSLIHINATERQIGHCKLTRQLPVFDTGCAFFTVADNGQAGLGSDKEWSGIVRQSQSKWGVTKVLVIAVMAAGLGMMLWQWLGPSRTTIAGDGGAREIVEPLALSALAQTGRVAFEANCAACHGERGGGTDSGPPFVNDIYNPGHHSDEAFLMAPRLGVRAHHWPFGNMPPVEGVTDDELRSIVRYVRELQEANGIFYKPHVM